MATANGPIHLKSGKWAVFIDGRLSHYLSPDSVEALAEDLADLMSYDHEAEADRAADAYEHRVLGL